MNYFEFYGIEPAFLLNEADLKKQFYKKSRLYHPDYHSQSSDEEKQKALKMSSFNNQAYNTLRTFHSRLHYILDYYGKLQDEGENTLSQDFLMEVMEINEKVMSLEMDGDPEGKDRIVKETEDMRDALSTEIKAIVQLPPSELSEKDWKTLTDYYFKYKYLKRIEENVGKIVT